MPDPTPGTRMTIYTPTFVRRVAAGVRYAISGVTPSGWFSPLQPIPPSAPPAEPRGRAFDYPVGYNISYTPRSYEPISFSTLRALAENCNLVRIILETRKDQVDSFAWNIQVKPNLDLDPDSYRMQINVITAMLERPDRVHDWHQWLRALLEDYLVIDAPCIFKRRTRGGDLFSLDLIDGATILPLMDETGREPMPPDAAYQQIIKGVPAWEFSADELLYMPRNVRSYKLYGMSPVEQIIMTVNTAIMRNVHQLNYYTEGNLPDSIFTLPENWDVQQVDAFQRYWDSMFVGDLANRRHGKFVPGGVKLQEIRQPPLKDQYDEWLARVICFAFSVTPEPFIQHVNRATATSAHDRALEEGRLPMLLWIKRLVDRIIREEFKSDVLEFNWVDDAEVDPLTNNTIMMEQVRAGVRSINEVRTSQGLDPDANPLADQPMVLTPSGYVPIGANVPEGLGGLKEPVPDALVAPAGDTTEPPDKKPVKEGEAEKLAKARRKLPVIGHNRPFVRRAAVALRAKLTAAMVEAGEHAASLVTRELRAMGKASKADKILSGFKMTTLNDILPEPLASVYADSGREALASVGVKARSDLVNQVDTRSVNWAAGHAADLVTGIEEVTRDELRNIISSGLEQNIGSDEIGQLIRDATVFSDERVDMIVRTEMADANSQGTLEGYRVARDEAGVRVKKTWEVDGEPCEICIENSSAGAIDLDDDFPSGDDAPPAHPNCECALSNEVEEED